MTNFILGLIVGFFLSKSDNQTVNVVKGCTKHSPENLQKVKKILGIKEV